MRLREIVAGYATALERGDVDALVALLTEDVTWSMPPLAHWYRGIEAVTDFAVQVPLTRCPSWRSILTSANGQPAVAFYLGDGAAGPHLAWSITVLTLRGEHMLRTGPPSRPGPVAGVGERPDNDPGSDPGHAVTTRTG